MNSGKVIRTKAEVVERQDGKGTPKVSVVSLSLSVSLTFTLTPPTPLVPPLSKEARIRFKSVGMEQIVLITTSNT